MLEVASSSCQFEASANINNNNNDVEVKPVRPKRDFRFKVIEVQNGPKWFVWPSRNRGSSEDVDENHNKTPAAQNGYGALRRSVIRQSKRKQDLDAIATRTASEPASARRLSAKKDKAVTEPINQVSSMFKIISIEKNWESFDATDNEDEGEGEERRTVSIISLASVEGAERRWTTSI